jgi:AmmeMemoRadiSam system protein A
MLEDAGKTELLKLARSTLERYLSDGTIPEYETINPDLLARKGVFVSLHSGEELRGCIGHLYPDQELFRTVQHCVVSAAADDNRFSPVEAEELPRLTIEISVLTPFQKVQNVEGIEVGRHGLLIGQGRSRGLLLPQVAVQYNWDRTEFLEMTCRKAGLPQSAWKDPRTQIETFEAEIFSE